MQNAQHFIGQNFIDNISIFGRNYFRTSGSCIGHLYLELPLLYVTYNHISSTRIQLRMTSRSGFSFSSNTFYIFVPVLSLDPVIGAIAAGNAVVLKPSEIAPATSSLLAKLLEDYVDNSAVRVVEGAVAETSALLEQKWDKIFYTGFSLQLFIKSSQAS